MRTCRITRTYFDKDEQWSGMFSAAAFTVRSTTNRLKGHSLGQLVFGRDMIIWRKHKLDWELIRQQKQKEINKDNIH